jgi:stearoyl-CoA desaturase (delta-9 desaturase)
MLMKKRPEVVEAGKKLSMSDLEADPVVMFQKRADPFWNLLFCFFLPAYLATWFGDSFWNGFLFAGVLRYVLVLNATWAVNSVVHAFGEKPYNPGHMTTENGWVALATIGEGWHNWHHAFDWDYAAAEMGAGQQFNPTKMFIDCMAFFGLAWGRKRAHQVWSLRKQRWAEQQGRGVVESIEGPVLFRRRVVIFGPSYDD